MMDVFSLFLSLIRRCSIVTLLLFEYTIATLYILTSAFRRSTCIFFCSRRRSCEMTLLRIDEGNTFLPRYSFFSYNRTIEGLRTTRQNRKSPRPYFARTGNPRVHRDFLAFSSSIHFSLFYTLFPFFLLLSSRLFPFRFAFSLDPSLDFLHLLVTVLFPCFSLSTRDER